VNSRLIIRWIVPVAVATCFASVAGGQSGRPAGGGFGGFGGLSDCPDPPIKNIPYDGQFTFVRLKYHGAAGQCYYRGEPSWAHGYGYTEKGAAEMNLMKIVSEISVLQPRLTATNVLAIDDPELFKYPVAFLVEAGYLTLNEKEVLALRKYLLRGGFLIIDDSREDAQRGNSGWANMVSMLQLVLPDLPPIDIDVSHPIFHAFFDIPSFDIVRQFYDQGPPIFRGVFEDNDPTKRLMVMINFNTDISNFWEYSALGFMPMEESNEAYKLGVNYLFYALTH
jgi:hypothetical protein